nr:hypothetical protein BaRGS_034177 [Batillaria attramentaria]
MAPIDKRTCSVCLELFQTPKILPCFHTFCQQCLADLVDTAGTSVTCPQCRRSAPVPSGGVSEFQTNFYIVDEVEHLKKLEYCEEHPDEEIRYYCASCEVPMCRDCHVMEHSRHSVRLLKDVILPAKEDLRNSMQRFHAFTEKKIKADLEKIKERKDGLLKARQAVEQVFDTWEEELKTRVKEACTKARSEALSRFDSDNENIRLVLEEDEQSTEKTKDTIESLQAEASLD